MNDEAVLRQGLDHRSVRNFDGNADDIRGRPGLGEKPRRHLGEPRTAERGGRAARRRSTFWASRTAAGRPGAGGSGASPLRSG